MQTKFDAIQLADAGTAAAAGAIRNCVHCGFCTATCPTYVLLGNELDSPRGRIYLVKEMLETNATPSQQVVKHLDRCLSCLACESTCPSGVSYRRVIDKGRAYVEEHYQRPLVQRALRAMLANVLPYRGRFRIAMGLAALARPLTNIFERFTFTRPVATMLRMSAPVRPAPRALAPVESPPVLPGKARLRVGVMQGCVESVVEPRIQIAAIRVLERAGCEIVRIAGEGCCGALLHHMGHEDRSLAMARRSVDAWTAQLERGLDAILVTASGCGVVVRDYGTLLAGDVGYAAKATRMAALSCDISELMLRIGLPPVTLPSGTVVSYQAACSAQHGQRLKTQPEQVLREAGFEVRTPLEPHLCCGSAGVYNILQPEIATRLGQRKAENLDALGATVIATGNVGCLMHIGRLSHTPIVHIAELLDWATGGTRPDGIAQQGVSAS